MQYIPSWAEKYGPQLQQAFQSVAQGIAPDYYAQKTFEQLSQQNPGLIEQISNMDDPAREAYRKSLGFKNKNPLANIGIGSKRSDRERIEQERSSLTPDQNVGRIAAQFGTKTQEDIGRARDVQGQQDKIFSQDVEANNLNIEGKKNDLVKDTYSLKDLERRQGIIDKAAKAYPTLQGIDINKVAEGAVRGQGNTTLINAILQDPGAADLYNKAYKNQVDQIAASYSMNELNAREANIRNRPKLETLRDDMKLLSGALNESQQQVNVASKDLNNYVEKNPLLKAFLMNPSGKTEDSGIDPSVFAEMSRLQGLKQEAESQVNRYYQSYSNAADQLAMVNKKEGGNNTTSPDAVAQGIADLINKGDKTLADVEKELAGNPILDRIKSLIKPSSNMFGKNQSPFLQKR